MEFISIIEASKRLGVTKQAIYSKLRSNDYKELQQHIQQMDKGKLISLDGIEILRGIFKDHLNRKSDVEIESKIGDNDLLIKSLENQIEMLKNQLEVSNRLLENQQKITSQLLLSSKPKSRWWNLFNRSE